MSWAGHGNFGDELILEGLRTLFKDWQIQPFTNDSAGAYPQIDFDMVNKCDLFVLGGGELINSKFLWMPAPSKFFPPLTRRIRLYARTPFARRSWIRHIKIPKIILGCGVDVEKPEDISSNVVRDLEQFSYIGLRDNASVNILKSFPQLKDKVGLFYDLVYAVNFNVRIAEYLAKVFPCRLHGLILAHISGVPYTFPFYHRKVKRVHDTIKGLTPEKIRQTQKDELAKIMGCYHIETGIVNRKE